MRSAVELIAFYLIKTLIYFFRSFFFRVSAFSIGDVFFWGALGMRLKGAGRIGLLHALNKHGNGDGNTCALAELKATL